MRGIDSSYEVSLGPNRDSASLNILNNSCINLCSKERSPAVNRYFASASRANRFSMKGRTGISRCLQFYRIRVINESVPGPLRDVQAARHIIGRVMVTSHRGRGCPREVIVQRASEPFVAVESHILQGLVETGNCSLVHLFMQPVAAVDPHDGRLVTVLVRIHCWPTECLRPVRGQTLGMLRMESVAERMANYFVLQHTRVPGVSQLQYSVMTAYGFVNRLHNFSVPPNYSAF